MNQAWRRNWGYKLISVCLAILLWLFVSNQVRSENAQQVIPLQERGVPANLIVTSRVLNTVTVRLQSLGNISAAKDLVAYVELSGAVKGEKSYPLTVAVPNGVRVVSIEPATVSVTLDELKEKTVPVTLEPVGKVAEGFEAGKAVFQPSAVTVRGPEQRLNQIDKGFVEVNLANASDTIQSSAAVRFKDAGGNPIAGPDPTRPIISAQPQEVSVLIPVVKRDLASKSVLVKASVKGTPANGYTVSQLLITPPAVKLFGLPERLTGVELVNAGVVDVSGATQDVIIGVKPEDLGLPAGVGLEAGVKITVVARMGTVPIERTFKAVPVTIKNLAAGQGADPSSPTIDIVVKGLQDVVNGLKDSDVSLWVDVGGLSPGPQSVQVVAQLPQGVDAVNLPKLNLNIKLQ